MARDKFHYNFRRALEKDGWIITNDSLRIQAGEVKGEVDLGAEKIFAAEKDGKKIAVEIKGFISPSPVHDFEEAYGQFRLYRWIFSKQEKNDRELFLAIPEFAYNTFFQRPLIKEIIKVENINIVVFDHINEIILQWINWQNIEI
jgi:XisH protein